MRLFQKAKRFGVWDPQKIDFTQDIDDFSKLNDIEKDVLKRLTALFVAGEEAVTLDLLPLLLVIAQEGRIEEEMYLTSFLWEEAKHTEFFSCVLTEVFKVEEDLHVYHTDSYKVLFNETLPTAMNALLVDSSPRTQVEASVTYNMIVEGVLAETGYHAYYSALEKNNLMPGLREGIGKLKQDESRHIAYGVFLLSRLVAEDNDLWDVIQARMNVLLMPAMGIISELFASYEDFPFGLKIEDFTDYAMGQFSKRVARIERAKTQTLVEVLEETID